MFGFVHFKYFRCFSAQRSPQRARLYFERARQQSAGRVLKAIIAGVPQKFAEAAPALMWHTEMPSIVGHIEQHADRLPHVGWDSSKQGMQRGTHDHPWRNGL